MSLSCGRVFLTDGSPEEAHKASKKLGKMQSDTKPKEFGGIGVLQVEVRHHFDWKFSVRYKAKDEGSDFGWNRLGGPGSADRDVVVMGAAKSCIACLGRLIRWRLPSSILSNNLPQRLSPLRVQHGMW